MAGVFKSKIRFRIFGPNPKYYSLFYSKDEEFVDLCNGTIHKKPYEIEQKPVRYQFYLSCSQNELKEAAYSWISIEDSDFNIQGNVTNISLQNYHFSEDRITFFLRTESEVEGQKYTKNIKGTIQIEKVYAEKKKCLILT